MHRPLRKRTIEILYKTSLLNIDPTPNSIPHFSRSNISMAFFVFFLLLLSPIQIHSRESNFFEAPSPSPSSATAPVPAPIYTESFNSYGLYGHGSTQFTTTDRDTNTDTNVDNEILSEQLSGESGETKYYYNNGETNTYNNNGETNTYNNDGETNKYNNNGYTENYNNNGETNYYSTNGGYSDNYNNNGYTNSYSTNGGYSDNYNNNGYESEGQGMSDTRSVEGGKYYYNLQNDQNNYANGYGRQGSTENSNEFNSMAEYENQERYQENQEVYVP